MNLHITGRHLDITPALNDYVLKKVEKIKFYFPYILDVHVILTMERSSHIVEVSATSEGKTFFCEAKTEDMYESIDTVFDKLDRQIKKYKERMSKRRPRSSKPEMQEQLFENSKVQEDEQNVEITKVRQIAPKPKTILEAVLQLSMNQFRFDIFHRGGDDLFRESIALKMDSDRYYLIFPDNQNRWIRKEVVLKGEELQELKNENFQINIMSLDEAIDRFYSDNGNRFDDHIVFLDRDINLLNILYKRKNNTLGLITSGEG